MQKYDALLNITILYSDVCIKIHTFCEVVDDTQPCWYPKQGFKKSCLVLLYICSVFLCLLKQPLFVIPSYSVKCRDNNVGVKKTRDKEEENSKRMNEEEWEKRVFTSAETEALMSPSAEWRAQNLWKIY